MTAVTKVVNMRSSVFYTTNSTYTCVELAAKHNEAFKLFIERGGNPNLARIRKIMTVLDTKIITSWVVFEVFGGYRESDKENDDIIVFNI